MLEFDAGIIDMVVIIAWLLWYHRNMVVHESSQWFAGSIINKAETLLVDFKNANV